MPEWKEETKQRLASLKLEPTREAEIIEELFQPACQTPLDSPAVSSLPKAHPRISDHVT
jgi:hypothetical protein